MHVWGALEGMALSGSGAINMAVTYSHYTFVTAPLPKRFRNDRFASETATWIQKWFKIPAGTSRGLYL